MLSLPLYAVTAKLDPSDSENATRDREYQLLETVPPDRQVEILTGRPLSGGTRAGWMTEIGVS